MPKVLNYRVIIEQDEDGKFVVSVPSLRGCYTEGDTFEEAINNIKDVIKLHSYLFSSRRPLDFTAYPSKNHRKRFVKKNTQGYSSFSPRIQEVN